MEYIAHFPSEDSFQEFIKAGGSIIRETLKPLRVIIDKKFLKIAKKHGAIVEENIRFEVLSLSKRIENLFPRIRSIFKFVLGILELTIALTSILLAMSTKFFYSNAVWIVMVVLLKDIVWLSVFFKGFYNSFRPYWPRKFVKLVVICGAYAEIFGGTWAIVSEIIENDAYIPWRMFCDKTWYVQLLIMGYGILVVSASVQIAYFLIRKIR